MIGHTPVRVFFHVDYKPNKTDRKVGKDEIPSVESQLSDAQSKIEDISNEIDHAKQQEALLKEAGGKNYY